MDAVVVPLGADLYAVPINWVREVVTAPPMTPLVTAPRLVLGLFNLRGEIVPLLDTATLLGLAGTPGVTFAVVLNTDLGPVGLSATASPERALLEDALGPTGLAGTQGSYRLDDRVVVLLDVQGLLDSISPYAPLRDDSPELRTALVRQI
jgi:purine-binding chemotaxis protein CheW